MDDLLKSARMHRDRAVRQRDELDAIIHSLNEFIANYEKVLAGKIAVPTLSLEKQADLFVSATTRAQRVQHVAAMMELAEQLIVAAGRPLTRSELLDQLEGRGFQIEGGDKSKVLGTNLWRSKKFVNIKGIGYWPKNISLPTTYRDFQRRTSMLDD